MVYLFLEEPITSLVIRPELKDIKNDIKRKKQYYTIKNNA